MNKIAIICAMQVEADAVIKLLNSVKKEEIGPRTFYHGLFNDKIVIVVQAGIGKVNASITTTLLIKEYNPDIIINCGVAGGYSEKLQPLDVVIADKLFYFDVNCSIGNDKLPFGQVQGLPLYFHCSDKLIELLKKEKIDIRHHVGSLMTSDQFSTNRTYLTNIIDQYFEGEDVLGVDMESAAIAQVAYEFNKEIIVVRSISDVVGIKQEQVYPNFLDRACYNASCIVSFLLKRI